MNYKIIVLPLALSIVVAMSLLTEPSGKQPPTNASSIEPSHNTISQQARQASYADLTGLAPPPYQPAADCALIQPNAYLQGCNFHQQSLQDKDLHGSDLSHTRLHGVLGKANLTDAKLIGATVIGRLEINAETVLTNADLSGLYSDGNNPVLAESAQLSGVKLTKAQLYGANLKQALLDNADLSKAVLTGANLQATHLEQANLSGSDLTNTDLSSSVLTHAVLKQADLTEANLTGADLTASDLTHANLAGTDLANARLTGVDLSNADLSGAKHTDSVLIDTDTIFLHAICPDGVEVDGTQVITCVGHGF